ncbi:MAG: hypothetical protein ISQ51_02600 [Synechococcus sp. BS307-5m-G37]|nr:hypothetical protein [Synechococcus sp. BS307-5m-G37]
MTSKVPALDDRCGDTGWGWGTATTAEVLQCASEPPGEGSRKAETLINTGALLTPQAARD